MDNTATLDRRIVFGGAIKSISENRIGGYLVEFTDPDNKDLHGEYFTADTKFHLDDHSIIGKPVLFNHGMTKQLGMKTYATFDKVKVDDNGIYVEAIITTPTLKQALSEAEEFGEEIDQERATYLAYLDEISQRRNKHMFSWSSGAFPQSVIVSDDGHIDEWVIVEGSETHTPANPTGTGIQNLKSITSDLDTSIESPSAKETHDKTLDDLTSDLKTVANDVSDIKRTIEGLDMTTTKALDDSQQQAIRERVAEILAMLDDAGDMAKMEDEVIEDVDEKVAESKSETITEKRLTELIDEAIESAFKRANEEIERKESAKALAEKLKSQKQAPAQSKAPAYKPSASVSVHSPYKHWEASDFSYAHDVHSKLTGVNQRGLPIRFDQKFYREFADKALGDYERGDVQLSADAVKTFSAIKADELDYSTQAGYGDEHVPESWREQVWERVRRENVIAPLFRVESMPTNPYHLPTEGTDPTVYYVPETTDQSQLSLTASPIPDSKIGTGKVTLTASKLALQVFISRELQEDAVSSAIPTYRKQAQRAMMDALDNSLANGDTATSLNINFDGGTPSANAKYMAYNGLLKNAIVTATTNAVSAEGNAPTLAMIRIARFKLNRSKQRPQDLAIITHPEVEQNLLNMDEFVTMDKVGSRATNITGQIGMIDGIPVFVSNEIATSDADGKITYDGNVVERGRLMIVNRNSWYVGYRRELNFDFELRSAYDAWIMTATMRPAFVSQDNDSVAVLYNIGI